MSRIRIECRKDVLEKKQDLPNYKDKRESSLGGELVIDTSQWFMDTESFFNSVKPTLDKYFDKIEKI